MRFSAIFSLLLILFWTQSEAQSKVQPFDKVTVDGNIELLLRPDDMHDVDAIVNKEDVTFAVQNGTLVISHANDSKWSDPARVTANFTSLTAVKASNGAVVTCEGLISADSLSLMANKSARMEMTIGCNALTAYLANGSKMTLSGKVDIFEVQLSDKSVLNAPTLEAKMVNIKSDTEASATVFASHHISATALANSMINVLGDPESEQVSELSGGVVQ